MLHEFDSVVLSRDLEEHGLKKGTRGAVVHCYVIPGAYEVEFFNESGSTISVVTVAEGDILSSVPSPDPVHP